MTLNSAVRIEHVIGHLRNSALDFRHHEPNALAHAEIAFELLRDIIAEERAADRAALQEMGG